MLFRLKKFSKLEVEALSLCYADIYSVPNINEIPVNNMYLLQ